MPPRIPPDHGFALKSFLLQLVCTGLVLLACAVVVIKGVRGGIEKASKIVMPVMFAALVVLMIRSLTLPGAMDGVRWYILKFRFSDLTPNVMVAALGHMIFSLSRSGGRSWLCTAPTSTRKTTSRHRQSGR